MKRALSLVLCLLLAATLSITAFAASASLSGVPSELKKDATANVTVSLSGTPTISSALVQVTLGNGLELVSGAWQKDGIMKDFTASNGNGVLALSGTGTLDGTVFSFVVKGKTISANAQNITVKFTFKNGSNEVGTATASASVKVACTTHDLGNSYANANGNQHTRTCSACGYVETTNHTWNGGQETKPATCKEAGNKRYTCTANGCGATKDEPIAKTNNHTYGAWGQTSAPTCTANGQEKRTCSTCQNVETRATNALGHNLGAWGQTSAPTCTANGQEARACSRCSYKETRATNALGHNLGAWVQTKAPTCTEQGQQQRSCSRCSHKETGAINALGHAFSNPTVTKEPTCTETGIESGKCTRCSQTTTNTIKATGHKFGTWKDSKAATCTEKGTQERQFSKCETKQTRDVEALGHQFEEPVVVKAPTLTEKGILEGVCKGCGGQGADHEDCNDQGEDSHSLFHNDFPFF